MNPKHERKKGEPQCPKEQVSTCFYFWSGLSQFQLLDFPNTYFENAGCSINKYFKNLCMKPYFSSNISTTCLLNR